MTVIKSNGISTLIVLCFPVICLSFILMLVHVVIMESNGIIEGLGCFHLCTITMYSVTTMRA